MTTSLPPPIDRAAVSQALSEVEGPKLRAQLLRLAISRCKVPRRENGDRHCAE